MAKRILQWFRAEFFRIVLPGILTLVMLWCFWSVAYSTSISRIASLQTIESYAFAVQEQLLRNFADQGSFSQSIHTGYDNNWTWSGHRALTLPVVGWVYGLNPSPSWLSSILILSVMLGAFPAGALGYRYSQSSAGFIWGVFVYLISPAVMALSLQDYQDLVFAVPALVFAIWALGSRWWWMVIPATIIGIAPREECIPLAFLAAVLVVPAKKERPLDNPELDEEWLLWREKVLLWLQGWNYRRWLFNIVVMLGILGTYLWWVERHYPISSGHDMPLENALSTLVQGPVYLEGWLYRYRFYLLLWVPFGGLALFAPLLSAVAILLTLFHMSVPGGHGVDRFWGGHCHHMAPAAAFSVSAVVVGGARLGRWLTPITQEWSHMSISEILRKVSLTLLFPTAFLWAFWWWGQWSDYYNVVVGWWPQKPEWVHPAWTLVAKLPEGAVPVVSKHTALVASHFPRSYTFDESLYPKEPFRGLAAATHLIIDQNRTDMVDVAMRMAGAKVVATQDSFLLITWGNRSVDLGVGTRPKIEKVRPYIGPFMKAGDIPGVPPFEPAIPIKLDRSVPIVEMRFWRRW